MILIKRLQLEHWRCFDQLSLDMAAGINLIIGDNGSGKTALLEAIYTLGRGRSFRQGSSQPLIQRGHPYAQLIAELQDEHILGMRREAQSMQARYDGQNIQKRSQLFRILPTLLLAPQNLILLEGAAEHRRAYLDWLLFYLEPNYHHWLNQYRRSLKQRNAALQQGQGELFIEVLAQYGKRIGAARQVWLPRLQAAMQRIYQNMGLDHHLEIRLYAGWQGDLLSCLQAQQNSDLERGYTQRGPHRAELKFYLDGQEARSILSRGQLKLLLYVLLLASNQLLNPKPILLIDDLSAEWGQHYRQLVQDQLRPLKQQILITALDGADLKLPADSIHHL